MKQIIKRIPILGPIAQYIHSKWIKPPKSFPGSANYWVNRYESGGNSGDGSYNELARFKADVINAFVQRNKINTVIEYGCGDGNQLSLSEYPSYTGFDISPKAISICSQAFLNDNTKQFKLMGAYRGETAELTLSLDVIFHLIEDKVFADYMNRLFDSSGKFVIVYSSNTDENKAGQGLHVRHRKFSKWVEGNKPEWKLLEQIPNKYPFNGDTKTGSFADFYIYEKA